MYNDFQEIIILCSLKEFSKMIYALGCINFDVTGAKKDSFSEIYSRWHNIVENWVECSQEMSQ